MDISNVNGEKIFSGVKPTGRVHIGNYFGAMKQFVDLQNNNQCIFFIADYHALTTSWKPEEMNKNVIDLAIDYLSIGLDPSKSVIFKQSDVPEVIELSWIFSCLTGMNILKKAHAFKDAFSKNNEVNLGVFSYPVLMAADILMYGSTLVPVGYDQKQHLEIASTIARKFNSTINKEVFISPKPFILADNTITGLDGRKMSKSYGNTIYLFEPLDDLRKKIMSIKTDSAGAYDKKDYNKCNVFSLHKIFSKEDVLLDLKNRYKNGDISYKESKEILFENIVNYMSIFRENRVKHEKNPKLVLDVLNEGSKKARKIAQDKIREVRDIIGINL